MRHVDQSQLLVADEPVIGPVQRACDDQTFELPAGIYVAMALIFTGFVVVLSVAFRGHIAVSFAVIFAFLAAFFAFRPCFRAWLARARQVSADAAPALPQHISRDDEDQTGENGR